MLVRAMSPALRPLLGSRFVSVGCVEPVPAILLGSVLALSMLGKPSAAVVIDERERRDAESVEHKEQVHAEPAG